MASLRPVVRVTNPRQLIPPGVNELYGASMVAARYCGFKAPPAPIPGMWMHGWGPEFALLHPDWIIGINTASFKDLPYWLALKSQEHYMRGEGYPNALAIGLPITYVGLPRKVERVPGSLLVMPVHSRPTTQLKHDFEEYARTIDAIRTRFSRVVVCVHPSCWENGYWVDAFRGRGFELVRGADTSDSGALVRLADLLASFEYVTTNGFGSHIAYAAYLGAKVSIHGQYAEYKFKEYEKEPFYVRNPSLLPQVIRTINEASMRKHYPFLFAAPWEATKQVDWAQRELGFDCRVSPAEMRRLFGWGVCERLTCQLSSRLRSAVPERIKHWGRFVARPGYREHHRELTRLRELPPFTRTETSLLGPKLQVVCPDSFRAMFREIFEKETYLFETANESPRIIDGGANIGLSVIYFKLLQPKARVVAFEPDPDLFAVLQANCAAFGLSDVELVNKALWDRDTSVAFARHGSEAGHIAHGRDDNTITVATCRLRDYLDGPIDLLKLDVEGAETSILRDCADHLGAVERLFVEYHSFPRQPQSLDEVLTILKRAGYHIHLHSLSQTRSPLFHRPVHHGMDFQANVFAFR